MNSPSRGDERLKKFVRILLLVLLFVVTVDNAGMAPFPKFLFYTLSFISISLWLIVPDIKTKKLPKPIMISGIIAILWGIISALFSTAPFESLLYWLMLTCGFFVLILTFKTFTSDNDLKLGLYMYLFIAVIMCVIGIYYFILTHQKYNTPMYSVFFQSDIFAAYILMFFPLVFLKFSFGGKNRETLVWGGLSLLFGTCLLLTYSRAGWITSVIVILTGLIFLTIRYRELKHKLLLTVVRIIIIIFLINISANLLSGENLKLNPPEKVTQRANILISGGDNSITARWVFWKAAVKIAQASPVTGIGPDLYNRYYGEVQDDPRYFSRYSHSSFLEFWCELGYPGLILLLVFLGILIRYLFSAIPSKPEPYGILYVGGLFSFAAGIIHSGVDIDWKFPGFVITFFFLTGLLLSWRIEGELSSSGNILKRSIAIIMILFLPLFCINFISEKIYQSGQNNVEEGDIEKAYYLFSLGAKINPFSSELSRETAESALRLGTNYTDKLYYNIALSHAQRAVRLDSRRTSFRILLGRVLEVMGRNDEALKNFMIALKLDRFNYPETNNYIAKIYLREKDTVSARKYLEEIIGYYKKINLDHIWDYRRDKIIRHLSRSYSTLANLDVAEGRIPPAIDNYKKSIELDGSNSAAYFGLGSINLQLPEKSAEAVKNFKAVTELDPNYINGWIYLSKAYEMTGNKAEAEKAMKIAKSIRRF